MPKNIVCKLTGFVGAGVKAHIIPRSFYGLDGESAKIFEIDGVRDLEKRSPIGEYDPEIVTEEGERYFSDWDDYAAELLVQRGHPVTVYTAGTETVCLEFGEYDYAKLKLFYMSLLWRADVTNRQLFRKVRLGPHQERLRQHILDGDPGTAEDYSVIIGIHRDTPDAGHQFFEPHRYKDSIDGINGYSFSLGGHQAQIKVDRRPSPEGVRDSSLARRTR